MLQNNVGNHIFWRLPGDNDVRSISTDRYKHWLSYLRCQQDKKIVVGPTPPHKVQFRVHFELGVKKRNRFIDIYDTIYRDNGLGIITIIMNYMHDYVLINNTTYTKSLPQILSTFFRSGSCAPITPLTFLSPSSTSFLYSGAATALEDSGIGNGVQLSLYVTISAITTKIFYLRMIPA